MNHNSFPKVWSLLDEPRTSLLTLSSKRFLCLKFLFWVLAKEPVNPSGSQDDVTVTPVTQKIWGSTVLDASGVLLCPPSRGICVIRESSRGHIGPVITNGRHRGGRSTVHSLMRSHFLRKKDPTEPEVYIKTRGIYRLIIINSSTFLSLYKIVR